MRRPLMAAARDQTARIIRSEPETAEGDAARDNSAHLADQLRTHVAEEAKRRPAETPAIPAPEMPAAPAPDTAATAAPKSGKPKFVMMGGGALLALAAA